MTDAQRKILIVEDQEDWVKMIRVMLEGHGYQVVAAASKDEGLEKVKQENPDLIVLDVMMPQGTEGFQFVWQLRNSFEAPLRDTPIVVLTAIHATTRMRFYPDESDGTYAPGEYLPVQDFVDKPLDPDDFLSRIAAVLESAPPRPSPGG